ncbi:MAG: hypothetical protein K6F77_09005 [Lachnospiraceae bacterium]|nr:hypothetical protein [Lachnospiraceae bacterium]
MSLINDLLGVDDVTEFEQMILDDVFDSNFVVEKNLNGNTFIYIKGEFPVERYKEELEEIGDFDQEKTWFVSVSEDGELVYKRLNIK